MALRLKDKVAVIIGGGSWIGREIAKQYAMEGAKIIVAGKTLSKIQETVDEINKVDGDSIYSLLEIRDEVQVTRFFNEIESKYHRIDILVNCAAIYPRSSIDQLSIEEWRDVIDTNLTGAFLSLKYASNIMKKNNYGKIIMISSVAGEKLGIPGFAHYGASKAGMNGLMRGAAVELAPFGITVNSINPGNIVNRDRFNIDDATMSSMIKDIPLGRTGNPNDVAKLALFLATDESSFITGQDYVIDGGETIR